jgi:hypothetical protein
MFQGTYFDYLNAFGVKESVFLPSMHAVLIHGSCFIGGSPNFRNSFVIQFRCYLVHKNYFYDDLFSLDLQDYNSYQKMKSNVFQQPEHMLLFDTNNVVEPPITICFKHYICQEHAIKNMTEPNSYCAQCFERISKNSFKFDWNNMTLKTTTYIVESFVIFQYPVQTYLTSKMLRDYYLEKKIPQEIIGDFSIQISGTTDLLYCEYLDHLCLFHFITKTNIVENVNCSITTIINKEEDEDQGKFVLQLKTTRNINQGETLTILRDVHQNYLVEDVNNHKASYHMKYCINQNKY